VSNVLSAARHILIIHTGSGGHEAFSLSRKYGKWIMPVILGVVFQGAKGRKSSEFPLEVSSQIEESIWALPPQMGSYQILTMQG
jgi:hypothetical protein